MGGEATHRTAGDEDAVAEYNIGAAIAISPAYWSVKSVIPILFGTGSRDIVVLPATVKNSYD